MDEKVKEEYLAQWPANERSGIMNQYLAVIREDGADTPDRLLRWLTTAVTKRITRGDDSPKQKRLLDSLTSEDAWYMAQYCLWWESLDYEEKQRIKRARGTDYAKQAMAGKPPTERQLKYLKALGCADIPISSAQASEWIDERVRK